MTEAAQPPHPIFLRDFRFYLLARLCSTLAQDALMIIVAWQAYAVARQSMSIQASTAQLGLIGLAQFVPLFILTPVSGWVADHFRRQRVVAAMSALLICCALALAWATYEGWITLPLIFSIAVLLGIARCFSQPSMSAMAARIVPRESLPQAIAFSGIIWQVAAIIGPALGGILYAFVPWGTYALAACLFAITFLSVLLIAPMPPTPADRNRHPLRQMMDGLAYVRANKLVLGAITLDLMVVLLAGAKALLPVYARDIFHTGAHGLGQLAAAPAVGAGISAIWLGIRPIRHNVGNKMLIAVALFGGATVLFGLTAYMPPSIAFGVALASMAVCGVTDMVSVFVRQSLIQMSTPDAMRGRVSSVSMMTISASNELGEAESGFLSALIGPVAAVLAGGLGAIGITLLWWRLFPQLGAARSFEMVHEKADPAPEKGA